MPGEGAIDARVRLEEVTALLHRLFGAASGSRPFPHDYPGAPPRLAGVEFAPAPADEEAVWAYCSLGASAMSYPAPGGTHAPARRAELFILSTARRPELMRSVCQLALYPFVHRTHLAPGHTVRGTPGDGVADGSPLCDVLLTRADFGGRGDDYVRHADGSHTHLLWAVPLYPQEREAAVRDGHERLLAHFEARAVDVLDLGRAPAVDR